MFQKHGDLPSILVPAIIIAVLALVAGVVIGAASRNTSNSAGAENGGKAEDSCDLHND